MPVTVGNATTNFGTDPAGLSLSVPIPSGGASGDQVFAVLTYAGEEVISNPAGWTVVSTGNMSSGSWSLLRRDWASGMAAPVWTLTGGDGLAGKSSMAAVIVKGSTSSPTVGTAVNRSTSSTTVVVPGVTVPTNGLLLVFAGDRASSQTSVTAPAGMTEWAKYINGGGGGCSILAAHQFPGAGASGTRTVTYGVASSSGWGIAVAMPEAGGTPPTGVDAGADAEAVANTTHNLVGAATGETSVAWSQVSGPTVTISNPTSKTGASVTPTLAGVYTFRLTATNASGSTSDDKVLTVTAATVRPNGTLTNPGNFTGVGGAASLEAAVSDQSDSTYVQSDTEGASITFNLAPVNSGPGYTVNCRMRWNTTPTSNVEVALMQGAAPVAVRTFSPTTTLADYSFALTTGEVAAITNRADLRLRVTDL